MLNRLKKTQTRDPAATRKRILAAAKKEYARYGLDGARVDRIAARAKTNKRMLYHYFGNKDALYQHTLEDAYAKFREAEAALHIEKDDPITALRRLVAFTWGYYLAHPEFLTLVNTENLHKAVYLKKSRRIEELSKTFIKRMESLLNRGVTADLFRKNIDPVQMLITIAAVGYHYLNNRYTGTIVYNRDMMSPDALQARLMFNTNAVLRIACTPGALTRLEQES
jgi:AcrR family transcriptional regulator